MKNKWLDHSVIHCTLKLVKLMELEKRSLILKIH